MQLNMEPKPVLALCLNPAWQKTLKFPSISQGGVNRAYATNENGGGKGVNVIRVLRKLGLPAGIASFHAGWSGQKLLEELKNLGCGRIMVQTGGTTRCCYTVIDEQEKKATELIEPSSPVSPEESAALLGGIRTAIGCYGAVSFCGSCAPGIQDDFYPEVSRMAAEQGIPVIMDSCTAVTEVLKTGLRFLKINVSELQKITGIPRLFEAADSLRYRFPETFFGVTDGPGSAWLFLNHYRWRYEIPVLTEIVSPIGAGDCATAVLSRRIAENNNPEKIPEYFREALACASASCLTDIPSDFAPEKATEIFKEITVTRFMDTSD